MSLVCLDRGLQIMKCGERHSIVFKDAAREPSAVHAQRRILHSSRVHVLVLDKEGGTRISEDNRKQQVAVETSLITTINKTQNGFDSRNDLNLFNGARRKSEKLGACE